MDPIPPDSLRAVLDSVFQQRSYQWHTPANPWAFLDRWVEWVNRWLDRVANGHPEIRFLIEWGLVVVLVVIVVHGAWIVAGTVRRAGARERAAEPVRRVERRDAAWHRREAARLLREGKYPESLTEEFRALILELETRNLVRVHPSKTPGEYALEPKLGAAGRARMQSLVLRMYALVFSGRGCEPEDIQAWVATARGEWGEAAH